MSRGTGDGQPRIFRLWNDTNNCLSTPLVLGGAGVIKKLTIDEERLDLLLDFQSFA